MSSFNVMAGGRQQVLVDEQQLQQLQAEFARRGHELDRLKAALETLSAANGPAHFMAAAMALCNEMSTRWKAERVGIGVLKGRYVRLQALSHTEKITRSMQLVQDIESAMEECLDQDVEILFPPPKDASFVYRFSEILAGRQGPNAVINLPLRRERKNVKEHNEERFGNVVGVLTLERKTDKPFTLAEIETLRLTCDLMTSRLIDLYENDRWIGAKALRGTRRALAWAVGAKHTWAKVGAIAAAAFLGFALFVDGTYRVEAPFEVQVIDKQIIVAPFDGRLKAVDVDVNDVVMSGQTAEAIKQMNGAGGLVPAINMPQGRTKLAEFDTSPLELTLATYKGEAVSARKRAQAILGGDPRNPSVPPNLGEWGMADEEAKVKESQVKELEEKIRRGTIWAPVDGIVLSASGTGPGELKAKINQPFKEGDELFEIGELNLRAELQIPEDEISEVKPGSTGVLKATAYPGRPIKYTVESINPIATPEQGKNVYKARVKLDPATSAWLKPGVQGLSKTDVRSEKYAWIWTRRMVNWVRMKLWF